MNTEEIDIENLTECSLQKLNNDSLIIVGDKFGIKHYKDIKNLKFLILSKILEKKKTTFDLEFFTTEIKAMKESLLKEDKSRREFLSKYIEQVEIIYNKIQKLDKIQTNIYENEITERDDPLKSKIKNQFKNFEQRLENIKQTINKSFKCGVLVCGDSGAGKSSFINLLLKRDILPVSIRNNTACQVRLTFGKNEKAEVIEIDGSKKIIEKDKFETELKTCIEKFENRDTISCNSVTIHLNCSILEGGLDIYDTIGLGESPYYDEHLLKDLNNITGVLFILKKNNPIGENTVGGLSKIINHIVTNDVPSSFMHFIINMCDQLDNSESITDLRKNTIKQIKERCIGLSPEVTTFSTKQELFLQKKNIVSEDYQHLMKLIQNIYINSINTKTVLIYEFLNNFVLQSIDSIVESEKFTEDDSDEKSGYIRKLKKYLEKQKTSNESFREETNSLLRKYYIDYSKIITRHFSHETTKANVKREVLQKNQIFYGIASIDGINNEIDVITHNAILNEFKEFVSKKKLLNKCNEKMLNLFLSQYVDYRKNKDEYDQMIAVNIDSTMTRIEGDLNITNLSDLLALSKDKREILSVFAPLIIPVVHLTNIIKQGFENWVSFVLQALNRSNVQKFYNNPTAYVTAKSNNYYKKFFPKHTETIMNSLFFTTRQVSKKFEEYLTENLNFRMKNISLLEEDMRKREIVIKTYKDIKSGLESIREDFCKFYLLYFRKDKYNILIREIDSDLTAENGEPILKSRNRVVYKGHFKCVDKTDSSILVYKNVDEKTMKDLYLEYIKHKEILKLVQKSDNILSINCFVKIRFHILCDMLDERYMYPMFMINEINCSLRKYIDNFRTSSTSVECLYREISRLFKQILNGLSFLHGQTPPLNQYDLTIDSIGYNSTQNNVKFSSISNETKVVVDHDKNCINYVIEMSHLPLEILEKHSKVKYSKATDVYCLGTVLYYSWVGTLPLFEVIHNNQINTINKLVDKLKEKNIQRYVLLGCFQTTFGRNVLKVCIQSWMDQTKIKDLDDLLN